MENGEGFVMKMLTACQLSVNAGLPEKRNCLHDQDSQLERHILVVDQGHQRPQLQMYTKPQHNEHLVRMSA